LPPGLGDDYVQSYDHRGHAENRASRLLLRRSRIARNDVLATVGVCVSTDIDGRVNPTSAVSQAREEEKLQSVISENEVGLWISAGDAIVTVMATNFVTALRQRIQVRLSRCCNALMLTIATDFQLLLWNSVHTYCADRTQTLWISQVSVCRACGILYP
jgi:hypothetical protein